LPNLRNCGINGAVKWINKDKVILAINNRRKYADTFWFSLFHELGHVLQQRIKVLLVSGDEAINNSDALLQRLEKEADIFSQNVLIPEQAYREFLKNTWTIYENDIINFAKDIGVHPGIVLGRLQMEKRVPYNTRMNSLKVKYEVA
jgi:HTH-type transcriptional regulator/antitoxin HigA